jgi:ATP-dependent helicase/nuclease subunit A
MSAHSDPQVRASHPRASVFVAANAGSGKTSTLVKRVARLLLDGARPEAILCITYTKAAAAEMQRRLFEDLGKWAVMEDASLRQALAAIDEDGRPLSRARALFARALETPGGLKIQTIHAFCEKLLRRFPLEAGVSPGFRVLDEAAAAEVSARARARVNDLAAEAPESPVGAAYGHFSVQLDWNAFNDMFAAFEARRSAIAAHVADAELSGGYVRQAWRLCGFAQPTSCDAIESDALSGLRFRWVDWRRAISALSGSNAVTDQELGAAMSRVTLGSSFAEVSAPFFTNMGEPKKKLGTKVVDRRVKDWLADEQARHVETRRRLAAARVAQDTVHALTLASAYIGAYEGEKSALGALDFSDLIAGACALLADRADAAWVLYKLDGGLTHILIDEAQDTAPEQWDIVRVLTEEFFTGLGSSPAVRTVFAVGDPKQSIFSFQGARPERLAVETQRFAEIATLATMRFEQVELRESWRSAPEILRFVDEVFTDSEARNGLRPTIGGNIEALPPRHVARRPPGGCVELWPLEVKLESEEEPDVWAPVDAEPPTSAVKLLAARIARSVCAMVARGDGVRDRDTGEMRPCVFGDVLVLVRRRSALFHEIIRALKKEGAPVGGADRLKLSEHGVFQDLMALGRFARFPGDDLALAGLLRGPFCDLDEESLFDLAYDRVGRLWTALQRRAAERPEWGAAADLLAWAREEAGRAQPFDFYSRFLCRLDGGGRSMRQRLLTRMSAEGQEALDAFLQQAVDAEARGTRDLERFLAGMAASQIEITREPELARAGGGEVRVMTAHGAKGLEAPIVILPDTSTRATAQGGPFLEAADGGFLWAPRKADDCAASTAAKEVRDRAVEHESARLLYVALTRARDRLIVCGVEQRQRNRFERSWYDFVERAFGEVHSRAFALEGGGEGRRYGVDPDPCARRPDAGPGAPAPPAWTGRLARVEAPRTRYASPSALGDRPSSPAASPLAGVGGLGRYRRGELIHKLLQLLPDIAPDRRTEAARSLLARERDLTGEQCAEMAQAALGVLNDPRFAAVFGPGSRAEAALAGVTRGLPADLAISGRVDRLLVEERRVLVVDFKTNRPAPDRIEDADSAYVTQMALYAALLAEIYPGRVIEAALVWTDGPRLTPVPEPLMRAALARLAPLEAS